MLVTNSVIESKTIEYKLKLPDNSDGDKKEFLADISSFANAVGGDIIWGVKEKKEDGKNTGELGEVVGLAGINIDEETKRIESIIRDGLDPRINGIAITSIDGFSDGPVVLIRVPNSWLSPHMIKFKGSQKFYSRNNAGKYPLDITEIKTAFEVSVSIGEKVRQFRDQRISSIIADDTPLNMKDNPKIVLHLMPIQSLDQIYRADLQEFRKQINLFPSIYSGGLSHRFNYEGILTYTNAGAPNYAGYTQISRNGSIEAVEAGLLEPDNGEKLIPWSILAREIFTSL